jgi:PadR family transcriptional regulator PadR
MPWRSTADRLTDPRGLEYMLVLYMLKTANLGRELKKGSTELLILSLLDARPRHGYDIGRQIELRSDGVVQLHVASLYPLLYRLEKRGWVVGRWVERAGERRRRYYRLTPAGRRVLADQKDTWRAFVAAVNRVVSTAHA